MSTENTPDVKPEIVFIFELIKEIKQGRLRIPRFQRPFVWRRDQMLSLLDSIRKRYPIGSLLVWDAATPHASASQIGPIKIPPVPAVGGTSYVLDGQQRLATLAGVFLGDGDVKMEGDVDPGRWSIWYNLKREHFEHVRPVDIRSYHFPLRHLMDTFKFIDECERLKREETDRASVYIERIRTLLENFTSYKLPIVRIGSTDLGQAVEIFARLNSKGQKISTDQIVSALAYDEGEGSTKRFNLAQEIDGILEEIRAQDFGGIDREFILRSVLAILEEDIYQKDWTQIFTGERIDLKDSLRGAIRPTKDALVRSIGFLRAQGINTDKLLPYSLQLVVLSVFYHTCPKPIDSQQKLLERWLWVSSFTGWFGAANPSRVSWLIDEIREVASKPETRDLRQIDLSAPALPFPGNFDWRSSRVRCTVLAMLDLEPRRANGEIEEEPWKLIADDKITSVSRIITYPPHRGEDEKRLRSSPANRILNVERQRSQAKKWLLEIDPAIRGTVMESHGIPAGAVDALIKEDYHGFLKQRLVHLARIERDFMEKRGVTPPKNLGSELPALDTGND